MLDKLRGMLNVPIGSISEALGVDLAAGMDMENAIGLWSDLYADEAPWLFSEEPPLRSLNLAASIAGEFARLTTLELQSEITGSARAQYLDEQYRRVLADLRRQVEYGCAKGGLVFKPYLDGKRLAVDYTQADCFCPTAFDNSGRMTGAVFVEHLTHGRKTFTRLEYHHLERAGYVISNTCYEAGVGSSCLGKPIPLSAVEEWAALPSSATLHGVDRLLLGYFRVPFANTIDTRSPLGVSVYSRAVDLIHQADAQYSRILWEYEGSELAIDVNEDVLREREGRLALPKRDNRLFRRMPIDAGAGRDFYNVYSPAIRDQSLFAGLNHLLRRIEFQCSLAYGTLSDPQEVDKTAEEIRSSKQRSYAAVADTQKALQAALNDLIYAMDYWTSYGNLAPPGSYEVSYNWDDSIILDAEAERMQDKEDVRDGIMHKWEFRVKWYGEDEEKAKRMAPEEEPDEDGVMGFADAAVS